MGSRVLCWFPNLHVIENALISDPSDSTFRMLGLQIWATFPWLHGLGDETAELWMLGRSPGSILSRDTPLHPMLAAATVGFRVDQPNPQNCSLSGSAHLSPHRICSLQPVCVCRLPHPLNHSPLCSSTSQILTLPL